MDEFTVGREPVQVIEIVQPYCSNRYGAAPCTAALGTTGVAKCYNTNKTCQDPANYNNDGAITWRFIKPTSNVPPDLYEINGDDIKTIAIPSLVSSSTAPSKINIGAISEDADAFGVRSSATITIQDHPYDDSVGDFYVDERSYIATDNGTFWGKWLARNPYYNGYVVRIYDGYAGQQLSEMIVRSYILDNIAGPDQSGGVKLIAKDVLVLANKNRDKYPREANIKLFADIDDTTSAISVIGEDSDITADYTHGTESAFFAQVDNEIISYTGFTNGTGDEKILTGVQRGRLGTTADEHSENDRLQRVAYFSEMAPWDISSILMQYATIPAANLDLVGWQQEGEDWLADFVFTGSINKPTDVNKLLGSLMRDGMFFQWWDERTALVKMKAIRPETSAIPAISDDFNILAGSQSVSYQTKNRVSRVAVYFNRRDASKSLTDATNYDDITISVDGDAESTNQFGEIKTRQVFSRWLIAGAASSTLSIRLLSKYRDNPRYLKIRMDAKDRQYWIGDALEVTTRTIQNADGTKSSELWQIISAEEVVPGEIVEYTLQNYDFKGHYIYYASDDATELYINASEQERENTWYYADDNGLLPDGTEGYLYA